MTNCIQVLLKIRFVNIQWDIDLDDDESYEQIIQEQNLPEQVELLVPINYYTTNTLEDFLSDKYGFTVNGFSVDVIWNQKEMTYRDLLEKLKTFNEDELNQTAFISIDDTAYIISDIAEVSVSEDMDSNEVYNQRMIISDCKPFDESNEGPSVAVQLYNAVIGQLTKN